MATAISYDSFTDQASVTVTLANGGDEQGTVCFKGSSICIDIDNVGVLAICGPNDWGWRAHDMLTDITFN